MTMTKEDVLLVLKENATRLKETYLLKEMFLFGSLSRGELANDVDILIDTKEDFSMFTLIHLSDELEHLFNSKVDIASKVGISKDFYDTIKDDLIAI